MGGMAIGGLKIEDINDAKDFLIALETIKAELENIIDNTKEITNDKSLFLSIENLLNTNINLNNSYVNLVDNFDERFAVLEKENEEFFKKLDDEKADFSFAVLSNISSFNYENIDKHIDKIFKEKFEDKINEVLANTNDVISLKKNVDNISNKLDEQITDIQKAINSFKLTYNNRVLIYILATAVAAAAVGFVIGFYFDVAKLF